MIRFLLLVILLGLSVVLVKSQDMSSSCDAASGTCGAVSAQDEVDGDTDDGDDEDDDEDDENAPNYEELLANATSLEDLINAGLLYANGSRVTSADDLDDEEGREYIGSAGGLFQNANCFPRLQVVRLNPAGGQSIWPTCTTIERCSGCVQSRHQKCVASSFEMVQKQALAVSRKHGRVYMSIHTKVPLLVERHLHCKLECALSAEVCGPNRIFKSRKCTCTCRAPRDCSIPFIWDNDKCDCVCAHITPCCADESVCAFYFDHTNCRCEQMRTRIAADGNATQTEGSTNDNVIPPVRRTHFNGLFGRHHATAPPTTTASTTSPTTTTTTTTAATTTPVTTRPRTTCRPCPFNFIPDIVGGRCVCRPPNIPRRSGRRRYGRRRW